MPQDNQINYNVKVRLDPNTQGADSSVIYDFSEKKFALGTGTGITINNNADNRITTATSDPNTLNAESFFRYVASGTGTLAGKLQIGNATATPLQLVDIGQNYVTNNQVIISSTDGDSSFLRLGMDSTDVLVAGFGSKQSTNQKFQIGTYPDETNTTFTPYLSINHSGRVGISEGISPILGKSNTDSNYQLLVTRNFTNTGASSPGSRVSTVGIQNSSSTNSNLVKVLQLFTGTDASTMVSTGEPPENGFSGQPPTPRWIEFYTRDSNSLTNDGNFLMAYIAPYRSNNFGGYGANFVHVSDKRLKKDIKPLSVGLNELLKIQPVDYKWKRNSSPDRGFIAQDLYKVYPNAVQPSITDDPKEEPWGVMADKLIPLLVKSIQEQQEIIENLKTRINKLENNKL